MSNKPLKLDNPAETALVPGETCQGCRHWHEISKPEVRGPVVLTGQAVPASVGECRRELVTLALVSGQCMSLYPQTARAFPACSHFSPRSNGQPV